jgi:hypothetical protein
MSWLNTCLWKIGKHPCKPQWRTIPGMIASLSYFYLSNEWQVFKVCQVLMRDTIHDAAGQISRTFWSWHLPMDQTEGHRCSHFSGEASDIRPLFCRLWETLATARFGQFHFMLMQRMPCICWWRPHVSDPYIDVSLMLTQRPLLFWRWNTLHCTYNTLHCITLHYITLHYIMYITLITSDCMTWHDTTLRHLTSHYIQK